MILKEAGWDAKLMVTRQVAAMEALRRCKYLTFLIHQTTTPHYCWPLVLARALTPSIYSRTVMCV